MSKEYNLTLIPGDGIGPEVTWSSSAVIKEAGVNIEWEVVEAGKRLWQYNTPLPEYVLESIQENKIGLKGPITTPVGKGFRSVNVALRQKFNLYANVRPVKTYEADKIRYDNVDLIIVRENTRSIYMVELNIW